MSLFWLGFCPFRGCVAQGETRRDEQTMPVVVDRKAPAEVDVALGAAIRLRRRTLGISQEILAEKCGVSFQQIQKYENGSNRISFSRLVQIASALHCRVNDLIDVLAGADGGPQDLALRIRMGLPGALELLEAFEAMSPSMRAPLVEFSRALALRA
jgi:transcriptional regulator with XRE-family HTH domain